MDWLEEDVAAWWAGFPVDAEPRAIVLLTIRVRIEGGFIDDMSKRAWLDGAVEPRQPLPLGLSRLLPRAGGLQEATR